MSITALTSYATTLRQVTPSSVATRDTQRAEAKTGNGPTDNVVTTKLTEAVSSDQLKTLNNLRAVKEKLSSELSSFENRFAEFEPGESLQADADEMADIGKGVYRVARRLERIQARIDGLLKGADPDDADGIAKGRGGKRYDEKTLSTDVSIAQRAYSVVTNVLDRFASIKSEATEQGDTEVLKSRAMKLADTHGKRVENWLKHMSSDFQAAAASKQKVSITV
ncbi:hypothetical protein [Ponticaulis sp.]|uniref:hypothetical protein n=1 Tax=Ponticaulis sp. TaxID=2020902 RepID=UPI0025F65859|nr:hypothetical protein [Ponticaulis sp.]